MYNNYGESKVRYINFIKLPFMCFIFLITGGRCIEQITQSDDNDCVCCAIIFINGMWYFRQR